MKKKLFILFSSVLMTAALTGCADKAATGTIDDAKAYYYGDSEKAPDMDKAQEIFSKQDGSEYYLGRIADAKGDHDTAKSYYEKAAENGDSLGKLALGQLYQSGDGVDADYSRAKELYDEAVSDGCTEANDGLGDLYQEGLGVEQDGAKALEYFELASECDDPEWKRYAYSSIGAIYMGGYPNVDADYGKAMEAYQNAADLGDYNALNKVAYMYQEGLGVKQDYGKAMELFTKSADAGNANSIQNIGYMYYNGFGVDKDYGKALEWYQKAADAGNTYAMNNAAVMYANGIGTEEDDVKAAELYQKAADGGNASAMVNLGQMYENGEGVEKNDEAALSWFEKAKEAGFTGFANDDFDLDAEIEKLK